MVRYILRRLLLIIPILLVISMATFVLMSVVIGDPVLLMLGPDTPVDEATIERMREDMGLNRPLPIQYLDWLQHVATGDLGVSMRTPVPVTEMILDRLPVTIQLTMMALALSVVISFPLGVIAALRPGSTIDVIISAIASVSLSVPNFWLGILLIYAFALKLGWLPSSGYVSFSEDPVQNLKLMILPTLTLCTGYIGTQTRYMRSAMLDILDQDYIRTARSKGIKESLVIWRHALRNALMPVVTIIGLEFAGLLSGAVVTETVYSLPGIGTLLIQSVFGRDLTMVQGLILFITAVVVLTNLVVDVMYAVLDPRIRTTYG
jgi:peptide/nickel transport system permease protein